jgi:cytochrome c-type biogenesis protein CcmH
MIQCGYASPARQRIVDMAAQGISDQEIIDSFVDEHGLQALADPPNEGFHLLSWVMPFVAIALGLLAIWWFVRRYLGNQSTVATVDAAVLERYKEQAEKDLANID